MSVMPAGTVATSIALPEAVAQPLPQLLGTEGDPDRIVATGELAARDLDWANRYSVDEMVRTGWEARRAAN